jgi:hypothetical protein
MSVAHTGWKKEGVGTAYLLTWGSSASRLARHKCVCASLIFVLSVIVDWVCSGLVYSPTCVSTMHVPQLCSFNLSLAPANISCSLPSALLLSFSARLSLSWAHNVVHVSLALICSWLLEEGVTWQGGAWLYSRRHGHVARCGYLCTELWLTCRVNP